MSLRSVYMKTVHPSKCKREEEKRAQDQRNEVENQAAKQTAAVEKHKKEAIETISVVFGEAKEQVNVWYGEELCQAKEEHAEKQADYQKALESLAQAMIKAKSELESAFNQQKVKLFENQKEDDRKLQDCRIEILKRTEQANAYYAQDKLSLDNLWEQVKNSMLHKQCQESYFILKQSGKKWDKANHYSMLMAYFRHLSSRDFVTNADFDRYTNFVEALY